MSLAIAQLTQPSSGQVKPGPRLKLDDPNSYRTFFAAHSVNVVPSPIGSHWIQVPQQSGTLTPSFNPPNSGSLNAQTNGEWSFILSPQISGKVLLRDSNWNVTPAQDGATHRVWAHVHLSSARPIDVQLQVVVIRGGVSTPVGLSLPVSLSAGSDEVSSLDIPLPIAIQKQLGLDLSCTAKPYSIGMVIEAVSQPAVASKAELRLKGLQFGTIATCCPDRKGPADGRATATRTSPNQIPPLVNPRQSADPRQRNEQRPPRDVLPKDCCDTATLPSKVTVDPKTGELAFDVTLPQGVDDDFEPYAEIVDADAGDVTDVYPGIDPKSNDWMDRVGCDHNIGGISEQNLNQILGLDADLEEERDKDTDDKEVIDVLSRVESTLNVEAENLRDADQLEQEKIAMPSPPALQTPWPYMESAPGLAPPNPNDWAFYPGVDIVYVHGLKMNHLYDMLGVGDNKNFGNLEPWTEGAKYGPIKNRNSLVEIEFDPSAPGSSTAKSANPEYYSGGYFKNGAEWYWREGDFPNASKGHIPTFLTAKVPLFNGGVTGPDVRSDYLRTLLSLPKGYANRYLIVSYSCAAGAKNGAQAILRQIGDAMVYGEGVVNPRIPGLTSRFGSRGIVIVSHSTGGLVTNIAMQMGRRRPSWKAEWIVDKVKLHVASESAMSGSRIATVALAGICGLEKAAYAGLESIGISPKVVKALLKFADKFLPNIAALPQGGSYFDAARKSILLDLVPTVAQTRWGFWFDPPNTGGFKQLSFQSPNSNEYIPPTVLVPSAHPTQYSWFKHSYVQLGLDDGVANMNSASGNPRSALRWPSGFVGGMVKNFDLGLYIGSPTIKIIGSKFLTIKVIGNGLDDKKRAKRFYLDQKDVAIPGPHILTAIDKSIMALAGFFAAGPDYRLTPSGMRTDVNYGTLYKPYREAVLDRYPNMFTGVSASADHFDGTIGSSSEVSYPNYQATRRILDGVSEDNAEETFTVGKNDLGIYAPYTPPGLAYLTGDPYVGRPVLNGPLPTRARFRGLRLYIKIFKKVRSFWLVKREYVLLDGWQSRSKFDYVYWSYLGGGR